MELLYPYNGTVAISKTANGIYKFCEKMIKYDNLWNTMKEKGISEYRLYTYHGFSRQTIYKLRHNELVSLHTINKLCNILDTEIENVCTFYKDEDIKG